MTTARAKIYSFLILLTSLIYLILVFIGYKNQNIDLNSVRKQTGKVIAFGEAIRKSTKAKVFYIEIEGLYQRLGVYRASKNYQDILSAINKGETVTAYFNDDFSGDINIDLIQLEKKSKVIIDKREFEGKESVLIWIGLLGIAYTIFLSVRYHRKNVLQSKNESEFEEILM